MADRYANVGTRRWLVSSDGTRLVLDDGSSWLVEITYWSTARELPELATLEIAASQVPDSRYVLTAEDGRFVLATYLGIESFAAPDAGEPTKPARRLHLRRLLE